MVLPSSQYEFETMFEYEDEYEDEWEDEYEAEAFFELLGTAARSGRTPLVLKQACRKATRSALSGLRAVPAKPGRQREYEFEAEWEWESNPYDRLTPGALMEHLGHMATEAESEAEAEAFIGALVPMAARLLPRVAPAIMRAAPGLIRGVAGVTRTLRQNPATRPLVRTVPTIVRRTAMTLDRQAQRGQPITPQAAVRTLAQQTQRVLGNPRQSVNAWNRSCAMDARYHRVAGGRPQHIKRVAISR
jgi:hypothetical protein